MSAEQVGTIIAYIPQGRDVPEDLLNVFGQALSPAVFVTGSPSHAATIIPALLRNQVTESPGAEPAPPLCLDAECAGSCGGETPAERDLRTKSPPLNAQERTRFEARLITPDHELWDEAYATYPNQNYYWAVIHTGLTGDDSIWDAPSATLSHAQAIAEKRNSQEPSYYELALLEKAREAEEKEQDWSRVLTLTPIQNGSVMMHVHHADNGVLLGDVMIKEDGYYDFWPEPSKNGYWSQDVLRALADLLEHLNGPWDNIIRNDPAIGG